MTTYSRVHSHRKSSKILCSTTCHMVLVTWEYRSLVQLNVFLWLVISSGLLSQCKDFVCIVVADTIVCHRTYNPLGPMIRLTSHTGHTQSSHSQVTVKCPLTELSCGKNLRLVYNFVQLVTLRFYIRWYESICFNTIGGLIAMPNLPKYLLFSVLT